MLETRIRRAHRVLKDIVKFVVGLGNPGDQYQKTRHNFGFILIDSIVDALKGSFKKTKFEGVGYLHEAEGEKIFFLKPETYMNLSGVSVQKALHFYKGSPSDLIVFYDDLDLPVGQLRFAKSGSSGGQKGMESLFTHLGTQAIDRIRLGIGRPQTQQPVNDYVLGPFRPEEKKSVDDVIQRASEGFWYYLKSGMDATMNRFNRKNSLTPGEKT